MPAAERGYELAAVHGHCPSHLAAGAPSPHPSPKQASTVSLQRGMPSPPGPICDPDNGEHCHTCRTGPPGSRGLTRADSPQVSGATHRRNQRSPSPYLYPQMPERGHRVRGIFLSSITVVATT